MSSALRFNVSHWVYASCELSFKTKASTRMKDLEFLILLVALTSRILKLSDFAAVKLQVSLQLWGSIQWHTPQKSSSTVLAGYLACK
jgi:hypothetical protein